MTFGNGHGVPQGGFEYAAMVLCERDAKLRGVTSKEFNSCLSSISGRQSKSGYHPENKSSYHPENKYDQSVEKIIAEIRAKQQALEDELRQRITEVKKPKSYKYTFVSFSKGDGDYRIYFRR